MDTISTAIGLQDPALRDAFEAFGRHAAASEVEGAVLVARLLDPGLDGASLAGALDDLAAGCSGDEPWRCLAELGFAGNADAYDALDNSNLAWVLRARRGIPISLGVLLIHVARAAGRRAAGVNFPGHFLVTVDDRLIDPFAMAETDRAAWLARLPAAERRRPEPVLFAPAEPRMVVLRMLTNIKLGFAARRQWHRALDTLDAQLAVAPDQPALYLERGDFWLQMGSVSGARAAFSEAATRTAGMSDGLSVEIARHAAERLSRLQGAADLLH